MYMHTCVQASDRGRKGLLAELTSRKQDHYLQPSVQLNFFLNKDDTLNCKN